MKDSAMTISDVVSKLGVSMTSERAASSEMTTDELRDECTGLAGWEWNLLEEDGFNYRRKNPDGYEYSDDPCPPTLDGAAAAMPEECRWISVTRWQRCIGTDGEWTGPDRKRSFDHHQRLRFRKMAKKSPINLTALREALADGGRQQSPEREIRKRGYGGVVGCLGGSAGQEPRAGDGADDRAGPPSRVAQAVPDRG